MLAHGFPSRAILASLFLATRTDPPASRALRAQVLHFSNCQTGVVGYHNDARAFKDLAEFLDHCSFCALSTVSLQIGGRQAPQLSFGMRWSASRFGSNSGSRAKTTRRSGLSRFPSQEGIMRGCPRTLRLGQKARPVFWPCPSDGFPRQIRLGRVASRRAGRCSGSLPQRPAQRFIP